MSRQIRLSVLGSFALLIILLLTLNLPGCVRDTPQPLLVGTNVWLGYEPLFLARQLDYFTSKEVRLLEFTSNTDSIHAFRHGALDAAALTLDEALLLAQDDIDFQVVLVLDISSGADVILGQADLKEFSDLKGRSIGVENTAVGAYMLARALETYGLSPADVTIVPLETPEHEQAFNAGSVDAVVTFDPVRSKLLSKGAQQLFDSSQIPHEIVDVLIVNSTSLASKEAYVTKLITAWFASLDYLDNNQDAALQHMTQRLGLTPEEITTALNGLHLPSRAENKLLLKSGSTKLAASSQKLVKVMMRNGLLQKEITITPLLSDELLRGL